MPNSDNLLFDKYQIQEEIARGGMGIVYRGIDKSLERTVAIKQMVINPILNKEEQEELIRKFIKEAKNVARLSHPNIVTVYDAGEFEGNYYIVMEYLDGKDLADCLEEGIFFNISTSLDIIIQTAKGLRHAHRHGIFHRDVKPSNIMRLTDEYTKIMDFGIAKALDSKTRTITGMTFGTIGYMSPEQLDENLPVDGRTDIFSLSVVLYQLATHQKPFPGDSFITYISKLASDSFQPTPPRDLNSQIPKSLERVIRKGMARNPDERYQSMDEFISDLESVIDEIKSGNSKIISVPTESPRVKELPTGRIPRSHMIFFYSLVALAIISLIVFISLGIGNEPTPPEKTSDTPNFITPTATAKSPSPTLSSPGLSYFTIPPGLKLNRILFYRAGAKKPIVNIGEAKIAGIDKILKGRGEIQSGRYTLILCKNKHFNEVLKNYNFEHDKEIDMKELVKKKIKWVRKPKITAQTKNRNTGRNINATMRLFKIGKDDKGKEKLSKIGNDHRNVDRSVFDDLDEGVYLIKANAYGYLPDQSGRFMIKKGSKDREITINLTPRPIDTPTLIDTWTPPPTKKPRPTTTVITPNHTE